MVSVFSPNTVNRGFIDGVIVNSLSASMVDRGLIGGVMVSVFSPKYGRSWVHRWCNG